MTPNPQQAAARAEVVGRLAAFGERKDTLHADIKRAAELGMTTAEIANLAHMSWHGVAKILRGKPSSERKAQ